MDEIRRGVSQAKQNGAEGWMVGEGGQGEGVQPIQVEGGVDVPKAAEAMG